MTTPTDRDTQPAEAGLFEDLPGPSQAQVQQAQAKAASKQSRGAHNMEKLRSIGAIKVVDDFHLRHLLRRLGRSARSHWIG